MPDDHEQRTALQDVELPGTAEGREGEQLCRNVREEDLIEKICNDLRWSEEDGS
ncbi:MAG: hypothetical protein IJ719_12815 [Clostridia bacterium]|nr:hypothetical protein [Clostridia bacterium]